MLFRSDFNNFGLSTESNYIVSINIRGGSEIDSCISLAKGNNGDVIYLINRANTTISSIGIEYWYY